MKIKALLIAVLGPTGLVVGGPSQQTYMGSWTVTPEPNQDAACCFPSAISVGPNYATTTSIDTSSSGCKSANLDFPNYGKTNNLMTVSGDAIALVANQNDQYSTDLGKSNTITLGNIQKGIGNKFTIDITATIAGKTCAAKGKRDVTVDLTGTWNFEGVTADGDATKCCAPTSITVGFTNSYGINGYQVTGEMANTQACQALSLGNTQITKNGAFDNSLVIQAAAKVKFTLQQSPTDKTKYIVTSTADKTLCTGTATKVKSDWEGAWKITPNDKQDDTCCFPQSNLIINRPGKMFSLQAAFDSSDKCKNFGVPQVAFTVSYSDSTINPPKLTYGAVTAGQKSVETDVKYQITIEKTGETVTYTATTQKGTKDPKTEEVTLSDVTCAATLKKVGDTIPLTPYQWVGTYSTSGCSSKCCCPQDGFKITQDWRASTWTLTGKWGKGDQCSKYKMSDTALSTTFGTAPGDFVSQVKFPVTLTIDGTASTTDVDWQYQGSTITMALCDFSTFTNKDFVGVAGMPGKQGSSSSGSGGSGGNGAVIAVVVILIIVLLAVGGFFLWKRHQANKLKENMNSQYTTVQ